MIHLRSMTEADIPLGMRLKGQAGWNQTPADWTRFLQMQPDGCFVAEWNGLPVGTTTTCIFGSIGWIAMVLVDQEHRHRGIGTRLVQHALEFLDHRRVATARLDATALGRPVYEKLGFFAEYDVMRMEGIAEDVEPVPAPCRPAGDESLRLVVDLDQRATNTPREKLLARLLTEDGARCWLSGAPDEPDGYAISRPGSRATQIGPAVASNGTSGFSLLDGAIRQSAGERVYVDVPSDNHAAITWAGHRRLTCQRSFTRMYRGRPVNDDIRLLWASSGPEKG